MTNEERDIIRAFIERIAGAQRPSGFGSVPGAAPPLPPIDPEADVLIGELFAKYPEARYRLTQTAFVQEQGLVQAQNRIKQLEWELEQARQQAQRAPSGGGGFFSNLFGGGQRSAPAGQGPWGQGAAAAPPPPPPPQYAPGYQPGMFQRGGSGFLGSALTTAAGVAGGLVVGNALMDMFSHHGSAAASALPDLGNNPWSGGGSEPAAAPDQYVDPGSWTTPDSSFAQNDPGLTDPGTWGSGTDQASWSDPGGDAGWTDDNTDYS